ncbi:MAG: hypothetical protein ACOY3K_08880 [Candidatus Omnitrophota bacterium]
MIWDELHGQPLASKLFQAHAVSRRFSNAYLITGADTELREKVAAVFAAAIVTAHGRERADKENECLRKIRERNHPDVLWTADHDERSVKIEEIKKTIEWASLKPYESEYKAVIMRSAERMTLEAANALLKVLEEPPRNTVFCLLCENRSHLIETIQSRVFEVRLRMLGAEEPQPFLADRGAESWEDYLDHYQGEDRETLNDVLTGLLNGFRRKITTITSAGGPEADYGPWLKSMDVIYETMEAVAANVNIKLCLTRLAMHLRRIEKEGAWTA